MEQVMEGSFRHWVNHHKAQTIALGGIVSVVNVLIGIGLQFERYQKILIAPWFPSVWYGIHLLVVLYLFWLTYWLTPRTSKSYPGPSGGVRDFYHFLLALWIVWAILYSSLAFRAFNDSKFYAERRAAAHEVVEKLKDPLSPKIRLEVGDPQDIMLISDAVALAAKVPAPSDVDKENLPKAVEYFKSLKESPNSTFWEFFLNWINNAQAAMLLLLFWVLAYQRNTKQPLMILIVILVGTFLSMVVTRFDQFRDSMGLLGGIFGGVAMCLWVGRLDSKFLMVPRGAIWALYFYAILQATWFVFTSEDEKLLAITGLAMILKVVVYLVCSWLLSSGRLLYFFQELRLLYGEKDAKEGPMLGYVTVNDRLTRFLGHVEKEELLNPNG